MLILIRNPGSRAEIYFVRKVAREEGLWTRDEGCRRRDEMLGRRGEGGEMRCEGGRRDKV